MAYGEVKIGHATYKHKQTGDTYELSYQYDDAVNTALGRAWELVGVAAQVNRWNRSDIEVVGTS